MAAKKQKKVHEKTRELPLFVTELSLSPQCHICEFPWLFAPFFVVYARASVPYVYRHFLKMNRQTLQGTRDCANKKIFCVKVL